MQIIIPMSGFGERFRRAGYDKPKPLIEVEGKPIIAHVVDMFPGEHDFIFICNRDHLADPDYRMAEILRGLAPNGKIVPIDPHRLGPVHAVLQARAHVALDQPAVVNYCDFTCYWEYDDFKRFVVETDCDGCVPAYKGFHPHSQGSTFYAYMRHEGLWMTDIQEKQPFTDDPLDEYASSGSYYFRSGQLCLDTLEEQMRRELSVNDEYYVSLGYKVLAAEGRKVAIYELQHFMQWGTPEDVADYVGQSNTFRRLAADDGRRARQGGAVLLPMAGFGKRFADAGYELPKPLIPVSGRPMVIQAVRDLPDAPVQKFVLRKDLHGAAEIARKLRSTFAGARILELDKPTDGQAVTSLLGAEGLDLGAPLTIGACDNGVLYDVDAFMTEMDAGGADVLVWVVRGHPDGVRRPQMFGWVEADPEGAVIGVSVKAPLKNPATDPLITGAFTFRRAGDFVTAAERLIARDKRVNGELYIDSLIEDCVALGWKVRLFEVDAYIGWGTPTDHSTFEYWQSCFHKWASHPYRLQKDKRVPGAALPELEARYASRRSPRPAGVQANTPELGPLDRYPVIGEILRFLPVGGMAVLIDFLLYQGLTFTGAPGAPSKALSFVAGAIFAFVANRDFTFRRGGKGFGGVVTFTAVYLISLGLNVAVNSAALMVLPLQGALALNAAWFLATGASATFNFLGMKLFVFRRSRSPEQGAAAKLEVAPQA
jgi:NDP-sugar pyrophosphorylase family protein/putative flippase GtrA